MKFLMCVVLSWVVSSGYAQFNRSVQSRTFLSRNKSKQVEADTFSYPQLYADKTEYQRMTSPRMTSATPAGNDHTGTTYWTSNITSQSYGQGKVGTLYYWDVQGNLREMKGFVDIAGKNKRGLKLVFPWR